MYLRDTYGPERQNGKISFGPSSNGARQIGFEINDKIIGPLPTYLPEM